MNSKHYPKVLILNETFKSNTGGGITLTNLFKNWPKECLANAVNARDVSAIHSDEICNNFYSLGFNEKKTIPIFSFLQKNYKSGPFKFQSTQQYVKVSNGLNFNLRKKLIDVFFYMLHFLGIYHTLYRYKLSDEFKLWVQTFQPDFIYSQISSREVIKFTDEIVDFCGAQLCIHIMDDWPSTISKTGLMKKYWKNKIDTEFRMILDKANKLMSISEGMSEAYKKRYDKNFIPFHNPIEIEHWLPFSKKNMYVDPTDIKILYAGRIGLGTSTSLIAIAKVIEELKVSGMPITFQIQTTTKDSLITETLSKFKCVHFNQEVKYKELPVIFSNVDILVLPIDFNRRGIKFLKYSMPTKVSEFMISGTPILLFCDPKVSLYDHATKYKWANIVSKNSQFTIKNELIEMILNLELRKNLSENAIAYASSKCEATIVRENFKNNFNC